LFDFIILRIYGVLFYKKRSGNFMGQIDQKIVGELQSNAKIIGNSKIKFTQNKNLK